MAKKWKVSFTVEAPYDLPKEKAFDEMKLMLQVWTLKYTELKIEEI